MSETPLRIGILGTGNMSAGHAKRLAAMDGVRLVALCDVSEKAPQALIERSLEGYDPLPAIYTDQATMYAAANLDAVVIVTPHNLHFEHGMRALDAGCHIYMEKPMVIDSGDARTLAARVAETGKILVIGYNTPCSPEFAFIRDAIREQRLGKLELVTGYLAQNWMKGTAGTWRQIREIAGGGQAYDSGAHLFNSLVWTVESPIEEVYAMLDNKGTPVDINSVTCVRFANGVMANITVSGNCPSMNGFTSFIFENGRIDTNGWYSGWIKVFEGREEITDRIELGEKTNPLQNFLAAIRGTEEPRTNPINGIHQSQLMDAVYESARLNRPVRPADLAQ